MIERKTDVENMGPKIMDSAEMFLQVDTSIKNIMKTKEEQESLHEWHKRNISGQQVF